MKGEDERKEGRKARGKDTWMKYASTSQASKISLGPLTFHIEVFGFKLLLHFQV